MEQTPLIRYLSLVELLCFVITAFLYMNSMITFHVFIVIILSVSFLVGVLYGQESLFLKETKNKITINYKESENISRNRSGWFYRF